MSASSSSLIIMIHIVLLGILHSNVNAIHATTPSPWDPEMFMNATELILDNGYPVENHTVQTRDGFIINIQRIPHGKVSPNTTDPKPVVLVQHGLLSSADCFVMELNKSLAFILADAGFDVWLGNSRGNVYGRKHVRYNPSQDEFWAWSWDEHAKYDLPATVDYVLQQTNHSQLYYIGHSQGTMIGFAGFSNNHTLQSKIKLFIALAPVAQLSHIRGFLHAIAKPVKDDLKLMYEIFGRKSFEDNSSVVINIAEDVCAKEKVGEITCSTVTGLICGFDPKEKNMTRGLVYFTHGREGTSVQNMLHYAQAVSSGKFLMYDFGTSSENMKHYNQTNPPEYDPTKLSVPTAIYYAGNDWLADPTDVTYLLNTLPNIIVQKEYPTWDHLDFIIAIDAPKMLYGDIVNLLKKTEAEK